MVGNEATMTTCTMVNMVNGQYAGSAAVKHLVSTCVKIALPSGKGPA